MPAMINFAVLAFFGLVMFNLTQGSRHQGWALLGCLAMYVWGAFIMALSLECKT